MARQQDKEHPGNPPGPHGADDRGEVPGGVRRQDGPEPYPGDGEATPSTEHSIPPSPKGGYDERRQGRGDYPGGGNDAGGRPRRGTDAALDETSRWRDAEPDERSDRWSDDPKDDAKGTP
jgi:hypothetical protein